MGPRWNPATKFKEMEGMEHRFALDGGEAKYFVVDDETDEVTIVLHDGSSIILHGDHVKEMYYALIWGEP